MTAPRFDDPAADAAFAAGEAEAVAGRWCRAADIWADLLRRRLLARKPATVGDRVLAEQLADAAVVCDRLAAADPLLAGLTARNRADGFHFPADIVTLKRAHAAVLDNRLPDALARLREVEPRVGPLESVPWEPPALPGWEAAARWPDGAGPPPDRGLFFTRFHLAAGLWLAAEGRYAHAGVLLERGAALAGPAASPPARAAAVPLRLALAAVRVEQGELGAGEDILAAVEPEIDAQTHPGWRVQWLELAGRSGLLRGDFGPALARFNEVVNVCAGLRLPRATLAALRNQAEVLIPLNQLALANEVLAEAEAVTAGDDAAARAVAELRAVAAARAEGAARAAGVVPGLRAVWRAEVAPPPDPAVAPPAPPPAAPPPANFLAFFEEREFGVLRALGRGDGAAAGLLADMGRVFGGSDSPLIALRLVSLDGLVRHDAGDRAGAAAVFAELVPHLERRNLWPAVWQALRGRAAGGGPDAADADRQSDALLDRLAGTFGPAERAAYLANKWTPGERRLKADLDGLAARRAAADAAPWYARPFRRRRARADLLRFLHPLDADRREPSEGHPAAPPGVGRWLWRHPRRAAVISYLVLPDRTLVAWSHRAGAGFRVLPVGRLEVRRRVRDWHLLAGAWADGGDVPAADLDAAAADLAAGIGLADLLAGLPRRVDRLLVVADDGLHGFPFPALRAGGNYLIERYAIAHGYDRTGWSFADSAPPARGLTVAVSRETPNFGPLDEVLIEAADTVRWLTARGVPADQLADDTADRAAVLAGWAGAGFVHAACHGIFEADRPEASGLVLSPRPGAEERVSVRDLGRLDLCKLRHVTLSCCWGADGFVLPGRWVVSLPETLCRRGAEGVLACRWPVADRAGRVFVARFYDYLADGLPRDAALRETQLDALGRGRRPLDAGEPTDHPFFWAGYAVHGRAGRLRLPASRGSIWAAVRGRLGW